MGPTYSFRCKPFKLVRRPVWCRVTKWLTAHVEEFTVRAAVLDSPTLLRQATTNPAKMLKQEGRLGTIAKGAIADMIVLDKNPLEDITVLDRPELYLKAVFKEGRLHSGEL